MDEGYRAMVEKLGGKADKVEPNPTLAAFWVAHDNWRHGGVADAVVYPPTPGPASPYHSLAREVAVTVIEKQAAYGDSFGRSGEVLRILYPDGISQAAMPDALTIVRVIDKLFRVATKKDALGESPWRDVMGYALLAVRRDEQFNHQKES
jgi:hypothetical protein